MGLIPKNIVRNAEIAMIRLSTHYATQPEAASPIIQSVL